MDYEKELLSLSKMVVDVLETKSYAGCHKRNWYGYQDGNGVDIGEYFHRLIDKAKKNIINKK